MFEACFSLGCLPDVVKVYVSILYLTRYGSEKEQGLDVILGPHGRGLVGVDYADTTCCPP